MESTAFLKSFAHAPIVTSADEAIYLSQAMGNLQVDSFIESAMQSLKTVKPILDRFARISQITSLIAGQASESFSEISVAGLDATEKTELSLRKFFNKDGPVLGRDIEEARIRLSELNSIGIYLDVPTEIPVLSEDDLKDGNPKTRTLIWCDLNQVTNMLGLPKHDISSYPESVSRISKVINSKQEVTREIVYTIFVGYSNLRLSLGSLSFVLTELKRMVEEATLQVALELRFSQKSAMAAILNQELAESFNKEQIEFIKKIDSVTFDIFESSNRMIRIINVERENLMLRSKNQGDGALTRTMVDDNLNNKLSFSFFADYPSQSKGRVAKSGVNNQKNLTFMQKSADQLSPLKIELRTASRQHVYCDFYKSEADSSSGNISLTPDAMKK